MVSTLHNPLRTTYITLPQIDVMMLYTETIKSVLGDLSDSQMESTLAVAIASSNQALNNSNIDAEFRLVYVGPVRSSSHIELRVFFASYVETQYMGEYV